MTFGQFEFPDDEYDDDLLAPHTPADDEEDEPGESEYGTSRDVKRTVWLRFDAEHRLVDVRVNSNWTSKLRTVEELEQAFQEAFTGGMLVLATPLSEEEDLSELHFPDLPDFGAESLEAYLRMMDDHEVAWNEAIEQAGRDTSEPKLTVGKAKGVTVTLNPAGMPAVIEFDKKWILSAQPGQIASHVLKAAMRAQEKFVPPVHPMADELAQFERERRVLQAGFHALLNQPR